MAAITNGTQMRVDGREGRRTVAFLESVYASSRQGATVKMGGTA